MKVKRWKVKSRIAKAHDSVLRRLIHRLRTLFKLMADFYRSIFSEIRVRTINKYAKNESAFNEHDI